MVASISTFGMASTLDLQHAVVGALDPQLVDLVVEHRLVAEGADGELEVLGLGAGIRPVPRQEPGGMPPIVDTGERPDRLAPRLPPRLVEGGHAHHQAREGLGSARVVTAAHDQGGLLAPVSTVGLTVRLALCRVPDI